MLLDITSLDTRIKAFEKEFNTTKGRLDLLKELQSKNELLLEEKKKLNIVIGKSVEVLNNISKSTKDLIKDTFENIVTKALQFIHQSDEYGFKLEFSKRGNLDELKFKVLTEEMKEYHNIIDCNAGGTKDIIALALRQVLLDTSKNNGLLFLDEPDKRLDKKDLNINLMEFMKEIQKETGRQLFIITHRQFAIESVSNIIEIKSKES
jgi:hypothetical protein